MRVRSTLTLTPSPSSFYYFFNSLRKKQTTSSVGSSYSSSLSWNRSSSYSTKTNAVLSWDEVYSTIPSCSTRQLKSSSTFISIKFPINFDFSISTCSVEKSQYHKVKSNWLFWFKFSPTPAPAYIYSNLDKKKKLT